MKHRVAGRKLGRTSAHRLAVLRNLSTDLFRHERVRTTLMKAKELRPFAERLITLGKSGDLHSRRRVARHIHAPDIAKKLVDSISTRFAERPGGYTRILKLGVRRGDAAEMAIIELIGSELVVATTKEPEKRERRGLGRLRDRLTRRKAAPDESAAKAGGTEEESEADSEAPKKVRKSSARGAGGTKSPAKPKSKTKSKPKPKSK